MILSVNDRPYGGFHCMNMTLHGTIVEFWVYMKQRCKFSYLPFSFVSYQTCLRLTDKWHTFYFRKQLLHTVHVQYDHNLMPCLHVNDFFFFECEERFLGPPIELNSLGKMLGAVLECAKQIKGDDLQ
jgi:hypothetical protein